MIRQQIVLRIAALLVPGSRRKEWLAEWNAELWYVRDTRASEAMSFCLGGFADAFWIRRNTPLRLNSPAHCLTLLTLLAAVTLSITIYLKSESPSHSQGVVTISRARHLDSAYPTIEMKEYRSWLSSKQRLFTEVAFYAPFWEVVPTPRHGTTKLLVARASNNLVDLLNIPISTRQGLLLSRAAWLKYFDSDPHITERFVEIAGQQAAIAGIISEEALKLPGHMDAWLLQDDQNLAALPSAVKGFALGRVRTSVFHPPASTPWHMSVANEDGGYNSFDCLALSGQLHTPVATFLFVILLAALLVPATTSLSLGEYPADNNSPRIIFFSTKLALILLMVYCAACCRLGNGIMIPACILAFRWALTDQRRRCPVCLRFLSNPVMVGQPSRNFLGWNGTELFCAKGHGLLHVPAFPTSWFSTQRWLRLDRSWQCLFP